MKKIKGLSIHCHHNGLIEYCYDYDKRVEYIKTSKPKSEIKTRLKLFKMLSKEAINALPKRLIKADAEREKAYAEREKAYAEREKANAEWEEGKCRVGRKRSMAQEILRLQRMERKGDYIQVRKNETKT